MGGGRGAPPSRRGCGSYHVVCVKRASEVRRMSEDNPTIQRGLRSTDKTPLLYPAAKSQDGHSSPLPLPSPPPDEKSSPPIKTYRWRWVVLALFTLNNAVTNYIWIMSASIADLMTCYYDISETTLNYLTTSYMMVYCFLVFPAAWMMEKYGLKLPTVISSAAIALGAALRVVGTGLFTCAS